MALVQNKENVKVRRNALQKKMAIAKFNWISIGIMLVSAIIAFSIMIYLFTAKGDYGYSINTYFKNTDFFGGMPEFRAQIISVFTSRIIIILLMAFLFIWAGGAIYLMITNDLAIPSWYRVTGLAISISTIVIVVLTFLFAYDIIHMTDIEIPWL